MLATVTETLPASVDDDRLVPVRLELVRLERVGGVVELAIEVTNESADTEWTTGEGFGEIHLFVGTPQTLYLAASNGADGEVVAPGATLTVTARYGHVPEDDEPVDILIPGVAEMIDVDTR